MEFSLRVGQMRQPDRSAEQTVRQGAADLLDLVPGGVDVPPVSGRAAQIDAAVAGLERPSRLVRQELLRGRPR